MTPAHRDAPGSYRKLLARSHTHQNIWASGMLWSREVQWCLLVSDNLGLNLDSFGCMMQSMAVLAPWEAYPRALAEVALQLSVRSTVESVSKEEFSPKGRRKRHRPVCHGRNSDAFPVGAHFFTPKSQLKTQQRSSQG